jgi:hypothetical protein
MREFKVFREEARADRDSDGGAGKGGEAGEAKKGTGEGGR